MENIRGMGRIGRGNLTGDPTAVVARRVIAFVLDAFIVSIVVMLVYRGNIATITDDDAAEGGLEEERAGLVGCHTVGYRRARGV